MALINTNIPSAASDVVGVFGQNFRQEFPLARPVKAIVDESAKIMEHPLEDGSVIADHIVFNPNEIELALILPRGEYRAVYQQVEQIFRAATIVSVQTRTSTYPNMVIYRAPHQEDTELYDTVAMIIRLRQAQFVQTATQALPPQAVKNPVDQSTVNNGLQQPGQTKDLPAPVVFNPNPPVLPGGVLPDAPNDKTYLDYINNDTGVPHATEDLSPSQIEQLLEAR
jgi:hypothetical protein